MRSGATSTAVPVPRFLRWSTDRAVTKEAHTVQCRIRAAERSAWSTGQSRVRRARERALDEAYRECSEPDWDGYGATPSDEMSMCWATKVLLVLPARLGVPETVFEPDGAVGLEWWRGPNRVLSVSVGRHGEIGDAARLNGARVIGTEMFADGLPKRLVEAAFELVE